uniref:Uncharacterized protein n=1 Tax=Spodoptera frugiperda nuclear polyhedrosis virus TaxID=10455 RepID=E9L651_NPVSF|nr:hypothetical protein Sf57a [Spodoptera frugiperda multiple nucleopolyhedrovirus]AFH59009.1 hypothetical protein Sf57a [Spodoptera frugiperda multiple nucleopolyhedrovirus]
MRGDEQIFRNTTVVSSAISVDDTPIVPSAIYRIKCSFFLFTLELYSVDFQNRK